MWELYDRLIEEIPCGLTVSAVDIGFTWTAVTASNGNLGLAMTTNQQTVSRTVMDFTGMKLKSVAAFVKSWNFIEASVGMAAVNSWYNSPERMEKLHSRQADDRFCTFDFDVAGKDVVMVGNMRNSGSRLEEAASLKILERSEKPGTYPDSACEYVIPESDILIITGSAFINKTMPRLLELGRSGEKERKVIVTGPTTPMAPQILEFGIDRLAGLVITDMDRMRSFARGAMWGSPYDMGERFCMDRQIR